MQEQNNFKYIYKGKEVSQEAFNELTRGGFKWFNGSSVRAEDFDSAFSFFVAKKPFKGVLSDLEKNNSVYEKDYKTETFKVKTSLEDVDKINKIIKNLSRENYKENKLDDIAKLISEEMGIKESDGKVDYSEINLEILDLMAERFAANKHKYPQGNMKKPIDIKSLEWALFRHVKKMVQPIETDKETYKEHLGAVLCNASMILDQLSYSQPNVP